MIRILLLIALLTLPRCAPADDIHFVNEQSATTLTVDVPDPIPDPVPDAESPFENVDAFSDSGFNPALGGSLERRVARCEQRLDAVEKRLEAIVTCKCKSGTQTSYKVTVPRFNGYGEFEVPEGYRIASIDGVPVERMASGNAVRGAGYTATVSKSNPRKLRFRPLLSKSSTSARSTCQLVNGVRVCN